VAPDDLRIKSSFAQPRWYFGCASSACGWVSAVHGLLETKIVAALYVKRGTETDKGQHISVFVLMAMVNQM
jgi:hypothetical protein